MQLRQIAAALGASCLGFVAGCSSCHRQTVAAPPVQARVVAPPPCSVPGAAVAVPAPGAPVPGAVAPPPGSVQYYGPPPAVPVVPAR